MTPWHRPSWRREAWPNPGESGSVDDLVLRDRGSERLYSLSDALFNVVALTDATGAVKERFAYQPYGQSEELNPNFTSYLGTDYQWTYRFTGRELDLESGLQLNRNRYLHQQLGRWISRDPIGYVDGPGLYVYVLCNPIISVDPMGLECDSCCCCATGAKITDVTEYQLGRFGILKSGVEGGVQWGHKFLAHFDRNYVASEEAGECTFGMVGKEYS